MKEKERDDAWFVLYFGWSLSKLFPLSLCLFSEVFMLTKHGQEFFTREEMDLITQIVSASLLLREFPPKSMGAGEQKVPQPWRQIPVKTRVKMRPLIRRKAIQRETCAANLLNRGKCIQTRM